MTVYDRLVALVDHESALIADSDWESLAGLSAERRAVLAALPPQAPANMGGLLRSVSDRLDRNAAALAGAMAQTRGELDRMTRSRKALGSYAQAAPSQVSVRG